MFARSPKREEIFLFKKVRFERENSRVTCGRGGERLWNFREVKRVEFFPVRWPCECDGCSLKACFYLL